MGIFDVWIGWFLLFPSLHIALSLPSSFCSRGYIVWKMLDEKLQDGCLEHGSLWCVNGVSLAISKSLWCLKPSIKFLLKRIYGLEGDDVWINPRWLFSARQSLICKCYDLSYFWVSMYPEAFLKFLLQRKYSLEDVGWRIPRWLFSALSSLMCEWDKFCQFWVIHVAWSLPFSFFSREYLVWKKLVKEFQDGC